MPRNNRVWTTHDKTCPVCRVAFTVPHRKRKQVTCSHACSNTFFRSTGKDKTKQYRKACFTLNERKCIVCGEDRIVAVHHYDKDHNNMSPENLIPLCPTHHQYMHSRHIVHISDIVELFRKDKMQIVATT